jgi:hypothetical protein
VDCRGRTNSIQEDEVILRLIHQHGTSQWTTVAAEMKSLIPSSRTSKQIRERYPFFHPGGTTSSAPPSPKNPGAAARRTPSSPPTPASATNGKKSLGSSRAAPTMPSKTTSIRPSGEPCAGWTRTLATETALARCGILNPLL